MLRKKYMLLTSYFSEEYKKVEIQLVSDHLLTQLAKN